MNAKTTMQLPFAKLTKAVVILVTAFFGNVNAAAPGPVMEEIVQLNPSESSVAVKSDRRSDERARRMIEASLSHHGERRDRSRPAQAARADDDWEFASPSNLYTMPHTLFGAGSTALSARGNGAPVPTARA